jgi:hypothetical protein
MDPVVPDVSIQAAESGESAGLPAIAGDVNGDGLPDILIGSPGVPSLGVNAGAVYLLYSGAD